MNPAVLFSPIAKVVNRYSLPNPQRIKPSVSVKDLPEKQNKKRTYIKILTVRNWFM